MAMQESPATRPWRLRPEVAGGCKFLDMGIHEQDLFDLLFSAMEEVCGISVNQSGLYEVENTVTATWRYAGGVQGVGSWCYVGVANEDAIQSIVDDFNGPAPCPGRVDSAVRSTWEVDDILKNDRQQNGY